MPTFFTNEDLWTLDRRLDLQEQRSNEVKVIGTNPLYVKITLSIKKKWESYHFGSQDFYKREMKSLFKEQIMQDWKNKAIPSAMVPWLLSEIDALE
jgi:hypothetical protein